MKSYLIRLQESEWSSGNGQCPSCSGIGPKFYHGSENKRTFYDTADKIGHEKYCLLARMMKDYGGQPVMIGKFKPPKRDV